MNPRDHHIDQLKAENDALKLRVAVLEKAHAQLVFERDAALDLITRMERERDEKAQGVNPNA